MHACVLSCFSHIQLCNPWTVSTRLLCPWNSPGKNTGVGWYALFQRIFPAQESNPYRLCCLHCRQVLYPLSHLESPDVTKTCWSLSHVRLFAMPWIVALQAPLPMEFSRQEYWSGLSFPSPGDLPNPGIKHGSPALQVGCLPSEPSGKSRCYYTGLQMRNLGSKRR